MSFVHLNTHSHYSLLQASCTVEQLVKKSKDLKIPAVALTDYGNMFGAAELYFTAKENGIKPIVGLACYYTDDHLKKQPRANANLKNNKGDAYPLILIAKNFKGYNNLCSINTLGYQKGFYHVPRVDYKILEKYSEDIIAIEADHKSKVFSLFENNNKALSRDEIKKLKTIFKDSFYLGLQPEVSKKIKDYNDFLRDIAKSENITLVAQNNVHYLEKEDYFLQDVLYCIGVNAKLNDPNRYRLGSSEFYFKTPQQMQEEFGKSLCDNSLEIAEQCQLEFKVKDENGRPIYHLPQNVKGKEWDYHSLKKLTEKGFKIRLQEAEGRNEPLSEEQKQIYKKRLDYELKIIDQMGFTGYFHIVEDFIRWSRSNGVSVGPGRGSGASSLVSYCLKITDLDPMPLNLIFERFLNPERISMPDFDIDFCQENRHKVIDYISEKYKQDCTSHVITYGRLNVRAAIRDAGRVLSLSYGETDQIAKLIPNKLGITLQEALKLEPRLKSISEEDPQIAQLLKVTSLLEGLIRHVGIHAAGIIIADNPIINYAPLYKPADSKENVIQYDLKHAEKIGLIKFDFLGLKTLTHITETLRLIKVYRGKNITTEQISLKDPGIYEVMKKGDTAGVFQFEGRGITDLLIKSQPDRFEDIVAINALYRPGPMKMIPSYLDRKHGKVPVKYIFPELESILKETYGIIVYQEHVHQIAVNIAGYSYGEADVLRRAMGKKIHSVMKKQKDYFLKGAVKRKYDLAKAEELFDLMAEFAKYGFNKSHAAAYCVLAAQTAWLKRYYPVEFFAANMTIDSNDDDKLYTYISDAKKHDIEIIPPHVNYSSDIFIPEDNKIYFSLSAIKGVGDSVAKSIFKTRSELPEKKFISVEQFFEKVEGKSLNRKAFENLVKAGAFDNFDLNRAELLDNYEKFLNHSKNSKEDQEMGQVSLFDSAEMKKEKSVKISKIKSWNFQELANFEKSVMGFYLKNHPLQYLKNALPFLGCRSVDQLKKVKNDSLVRVCVFIKDIRRVITRKNKVMAFCQFEDGEGTLEGVIFPETYKKLLQHLPHKGSLVLTEGRWQKEGNNMQIVVEKFMPLEGYLKNLKEISLKISPGLEEKSLNRIKDILSNIEQGQTNISLQTSIPDKKAVVEILAKGIPQKISVDTGLIVEINSVLKDKGSISFL